MALKRPSKKITKILQSFVALDPSQTAAASFFLHQGGDLYKLEILASVLNDVPQGSPNRYLADLIERLVTTSPAKQGWVRQENPPPLISTTCTPSPGSPLFGLNRFLETNPLILRIEGLERANGKVEICATHIPFSVLTGDSNLKVMDEIVWLLWEVFYRRMDLTRLKTCEICHKWFVDHTKNKSKTLCSSRACTNQKWSWEARKKRKEEKNKYAKEKKS